MKILITGGSGFIGSHLVEYLLTHTALNIIILDKTSSTYNHPRVMIYKEDITNPDLDYIFANGITFICHLAAYVSVSGSIEEPLLCYKTNVEGFINILEYARKYHIKRVIYASSSAVYGNGEGKLLSPYAMSKLINEQYAKLYTDLYGVKCVGLRYFNVYGPKQNPFREYASVIPKFIEKLKNDISPIIYGDGNQKRDFVSVDDVVYANYRALFISEEDIIGRVFNIGNGKSYSINEICVMIKTMMNKIHIDVKYLPARQGDIINSIADIEESRKMGLINNSKLEIKLREMINDIR